MHTLLPPWPLLSAFFIASFLLAVTPGPAVFYIVTRSLSQGRRAGLASVAGVALGNLGNALGASIGLAALFAISAVAFPLVKYAGALYLVYLGVQALRAPKADTQTAIAPEASFKRVFRDGFVVALFNPKTAVFFAAFLPQFMNIGSASVMQSFVLGGLFVAVASITDTTYALTAGTIAPYIKSAKGLRAFGRYLTGGAFIGLGVLTAFSGSHKTSATP
jgi:threonine/homoserine/homoserine lactone efflux protein